LCDLATCASTAWTLHPATGDDVFHHGSWARRFHRAKIVGREPDRREARLSARACISSRHSAAARAEAAGSGAGRSSCSMRAFSAAISSLLVISASKLLSDLVERGVNVVEFGGLGLDLCAEAFEFAILFLALVCPLVEFAVDLGELSLDRLEVAH